MHLLTEQKVVVACDADRAFSLVANMENFGRWFPGVLSVTAANALPHTSVGKQYLEKVLQPDGSEAAIMLRVVDVVSNRRFVTEGDFSPLLPRMEVEFDPQEAGCLVTWRMLSRNQDPQVVNMLLPMVRHVLDERAALGMARLKQLLEG